jgi:hypothetical protein
VSTHTVSPVEPEQQLEAELDLRLSDHPEPLQVARRGGLSSNPKTMQFANTIVLAVLFGAPALMCAHAACAGDFDIWWHLRTGEWIIQHHAVPQVDPFSASLAGKPWQAYSWLFELLVTKLYRHLGLVGIVAYTSTMVMAITVALYYLVKRLQPDFSLAVLITFISGFTIAHLYTPRPWMFTILFFVLELNILMQARRTGRIRELAWLPIIFALWANIHIEYIDGLLVLGLALSESILSRWWSAAETRIKPGWMGAALLTSALATLANPYGWRIYAVVFDYSSRLASTGGALNKVSELQAIPFRDVSDFLLLGLALASAAALAWHRRLVVFEVGLLLFAMFTSFRSQRDIWVMAMVAATILSSRIAIPGRTHIRIPSFATAAAVAAAGLALFAGFRVMGINSSMLQSQIAKTLPVDAVKAIQASGYTGPVYDDYNWGGYLVWALRMPVVIDGRASFYGDQRIDRSIATWTGMKDWASDPDLKAAGIVIGPANESLTQLLRTDSHYRLVYEDKISAVFVAQK